jgi:beta-lactamase superfamily II metal-dependent hydrolase
MTRRAARRASPSPGLTAASPQPQPAIRIRMYDVGFGDAFLLFVPTREGLRKILIDCGTIAAGKRTLVEIIGRIIGDITESDGKPCLDVVVATHRHRDHVAGFADLRWNGVEVKEVWMPWTEMPDDPDACRIRQAQTRLAAVLHSRLLHLGTDHGSVDLALNATANDDAMVMLHHGFAGRPRRRFLPDRKTHDRILKTDVLSGVLVHVLGPSDDEDIIRDMDPPAGHSYLALAGDRADGQDVPEPFGIDWVDETPVIRLKPDDEQTIRTADHGREELLAAQLDKAVNGTSLMLLFQVGEAKLLFPGDAQWGTWKRVLKDPEMDRLLDKIRFYKVGHHGSHNATPLDFVEQHLGTVKREDLWAMVSVRPHARFPDIPRGPLLERLRRCTDNLARSDERPLATGFAREADWWVEATIPVD